MTRIKNWHRFQHFNNRRPPWVKLYRDLLDDIEWNDLDPAAAKALVMLWLIASEDDGNLPDMRQLAFRLRISEKQVRAVISQLAHWVDDADITLISDRYQSDAPERETQVTSNNTETEEESMSVPRKPTPVKNTYPDVFEEFWKAYPTDPIQSKKEAFTQWQKLTTEDRDRVRRAAPHFADYCRKSPDYRPVHACRFISQRRFEAFQNAIAHITNVTNFDDAIARLTGGSTLATA